MSLRALQRQWDRYGRSDPLWAVLSLPEKRHGQWREEEFFATGVREIEDVLSHARGLKLEPGRQRALDFGCGVGRLTQALAPHFERCDGVDIAPSMIAAAERYNRHPGRCVYHLNARPDLALFPDRWFSFVYTSLVLQHIPAELSRGYLRELLRVLAPRGLLVFHLPSEPFPAGGGAHARRSLARGPLPRAAFSARIETATSELLGPTGQEAGLKLRVTNTGGYPWPALAGPSARHQVTLAGRFLSTSGERLDTAEVRSPLPRDIDPGEAVEIFLRPPLPRVAGAYLLEVDLVQEGVAWFHERSGTASLRLPSRALGGDPAAAALRVLPSAPRPTGTPFRQRHPRAHWLLAGVLRLPAIRNAALRAGEALVWHARMAASHAREGLRRVLDPPMPMNGIPRPQVEALLRDSGGRLLEAENSELTLAGWQAYRYWVTRD